MAETIARALPESKPQTRFHLLKVLSALGGEKAYQAIRGSLEIEEADVRKTAIRILSNWPDGLPMDEMLKVAKEDKDAANQTVALRAYIRMAGQQGGMDRKIAAYRVAAELVKQPDEIRRLLSGVAGLSSVEALKLAEPYLANRDVENEAFNAYDRIAMSLVKSNAGAAKEALLKVAKGAPDPKLRAAAGQAAEGIK
jgi:hypothetical protein